MRSFPSSCFHIIHRPFSILYCVCPHIISFNTQTWLCPVFRSIYSIFIHHNTQVLTLYKDIFAHVIHDYQVYQFNYFSLRQIAFTLTNTRMKEKNPTKIAHYTKKEFEKKFSGKFLFNSNRFPQNCLPSFSSSFFLIRKLFTAGVGKEKKICDENSFYLGNSR